VLLRLVPSLSCVAWPGAVLFRLVAGAVLLRLVPSTITLSELYYNDKLAGEESAIAGHTSTILSCQCTNHFSSSSFCWVKISTYVSYV
jgi:hypothetical protein